MTGGAKSGADLRFIHSGIQLLYLQVASTLTLILVILGSEETERLRRKLVLYCVCLYCAVNMRSTDNLSWYLMLFDNPTPIPTFAIQGYHHARAHSSSLGINVFLVVSIQISRKSYIIRSTYPMLDHTGS